MRVAALPRFRGLTGLSGVAGGRWVTGFTTTCPAITPSLGAEKVSNWNMEGGDPPWYWNGYNATLTRQSDERTGGVGDYSLQIANVGANWGQAWNADSLALVIGTEYQVSAWEKNGTSAWGSLWLSDGSTTYGSMTAGSATWANMLMTCRALAINSIAYVNNGQNTDGMTTRWDDVSIKAMTLASCLAFVGDPRTRLATFDCAPTLTAQTKCGIMVGLDSITTPLYFLLAYHDGTNVHLEKVENGVYTSLINTAGATYVAEHQLRLQQSSLNTWKLLYNGVQVGTDQTIDTSSGYGTKVAGYSTYATNTPGTISATGVSISYIIAPFIAANTPAGGGEILSNPGFEGTYTGGVANGWAGWQGTATEEATTKHGGSKSQKLVATGASGEIYFAGTQDTNHLYLTSVWVFCSATGRIALRSDSTIGVVNVGTGAWEQLAVADIVTTNRPHIAATGAATTYIDDASSILLTRSTLFDLKADVNANGVFQCAVTDGSAGFQSGMAHWDSATPGDASSGWVAYVKKVTGQVILEKYTSGTRTGVAAGAITYVPGAILKVVRVGATFQLFYNGTQVDTDKTISDAQIGSLTHFGGFRSSATAVVSDIQHRLPSMPTGPTGAGWALTFEDHFDAVSLDAAKWSMAPWWNHDHAALEAEYYLTDGSAHEFANSCLRLKAWKQTANGKDYQSGMLSSFDLFSQNYGYFEARLKCEYQKGLWPAFWLLRNVASDGAWPPEIDIVELWGGLTHAKQNYHYYTNEADKLGSHAYTVVDEPSLDWWSNFHAYACEWNATEIIFYIDGYEQGRVSTVAMNNNGAMYIMLNLGIDMTYMGPPDVTNTWPAYFDVDYVKVWQKTA